MSDEERPMPLHPSLDPGGSHCAAVRPLLSQEELSPEERKELESHLAGCESCRRLRNEHRAVWSLLASASLPASAPADAEFLSLVKGRLCSPPGPPEGMPRGRRWPTRILRISWLAAAAAAVLAVAGVLWSLSGSEDQAIIDNLTVLEDLQAVQVGSEMEFADVGRELLSFFDEESESADADEWLDLLEGSVPTKKG